MDAANPEPAFKRADEPAIFSAVIVPHRSLSVIGFFILMAIVAGSALFAGLVFLLLGAWPVAVFLALGVALVFLAFRANYLAARARETVDVSTSAVLVRHIGAQGGSSEWRFNPRWVRFLVECDADNEVERLALRSRGRELEIGSWLSRREKADFANAFSAALATARTGRTATSP